MLAVFSYVGRLSLSLGRECVLVLGVTKMMFSGHLRDDQQALTANVEYKKYS